MKLRVSVVQGPSREVSHAPSQSRLGLGRCGLGQQDWWTLRGSAPRALMIAALSEVLAGIFASARGWGAQKNEVRICYGVPSRVNVGLECLGSSGTKGTTTNSPN